MSTNIAELFLSDLTVVDHAYIDDSGNVVGGSFNPTFYVAGNVDPVEQVVVDFSTIKKDIKNIIDSRLIGFDHKLWVIDGYSNVNTLSWNSLSHDTDATQVEIETPTTKLSIPESALKHIVTTDPKYANYTTDSIGYFFAELVQAGLRKQYGDSIVVECINNLNTHEPYNTIWSPSFFTYAHGLKDSTSWGCQNIAHGHFSFIQAYPGSFDVSNLLDKIAEDINEAIFINAANILEESEDIITIGYETERGSFLATYLKMAYNLIVLPTETTVEHLVDYVAERYKAELTGLRVEKLFVSEGLSKGAIKRFNYTD